MCNAFCSWVETWACWSWYKMKYLHQARTGVNPDTQKNSMENIIMKHIALFLKFLSVAFRICNRPFNCLKSKYFFSISGKLFYQTINVYWIIFIRKFRRTCHKRTFEINEELMVKSSTIYQNALCECIGIKITSNRKYMYKLFFRKKWRSVINF